MAFAALASASLAFAWGACKTDRIDSHCTPDTPNYKADPSCIYAGNGEMPLFDEGPCKPDGADAGVPAKPATCPTFKELLAFCTDSTKGNCTNAACHGNAASPAAGILLDPGDTQKFYTTLTTVTGSVGRPYVSLQGGKSVYEDSWMLCNVLAKHGGGYPMPPESGVPNPADAQVVRDWLLCGAPSQ
jgi:hypothetical protein